MSVLARGLGWGNCVAGVVIWAGLAIGQTAPAKAAVPGQTAAIAATDADREAAEALIGRALFLRGFPSGNDLSYDASGRMQGVPKADDWTLAGMDVKKAERRGPKQVYLEGVRVAVRYNPDNHQFERHPQQNETVRLLIAETGNSQAFEAALDAVSAQGIDPRLQQATPGYWQHYFNPALGFPQDALSGQQVYAVGTAPGGQGAAEQIVPPVVTHKVDAKMTSFAERDRCRGRWCCGWWLMLRVFRSGS